MSVTKEFDAIVVGAGPAGSSCARFLTEAGRRVAVLDRAAFPRVKLCAGWLSNAVWTELRIDPGDYPGSLWKWNRCHVHFGERCHHVDVDGYFIRRYEFDDFLVRSCGAALFETAVKTIERVGAEWLVNGEFRAPFIVGAAGTHCPVARHLIGKRANRPAGARELEFEANPAEVAASRLGEDGEPELYLHPDLRGYSWNIPKSDWLNVGTGTLEAKQVKPAWRRARQLFTDSGHLPEGAGAALEAAKGHSYYLFEPTHLARCVNRSALLVGDALGLAHPFTAEGIRPAIVSARLAADAIAENDSESYRTRMRQHSLFVEYSTLWRIRDTGGALRRSGDEASVGAGRAKGRARKGAEAAVHRWVARSFASMFSGRPLPAYRFFGSVLKTARRWDRLVSPATLERTRNDAAR